VIGLIGAGVDFKSEKDQEKTTALQRLWLEEYKQKIKELGATFIDIFNRLDALGVDIQKRIESPEYLALVKKNFRIWDHTDTIEKKLMLKKLITNAGGINLCPDDLIRLFHNWVDQYHEAHFLIIKQIYKNPGMTRGDIWDEIHGDRPREDSAEADLFKYLISELSVGRVIRQARETDSYGRFVKKTPTRRPPGEASKLMESAFEETKPYVLTELGAQFVHYVMEDVVPEIGTRTEE
jgi:hypothetical protein